MKKLLLLLTAVCINFSSMAATEINGIYYDLDDINHTATVVKPPLLSDYSGEMVIPVSVLDNGETYLVTTIGASAFEATGITAITIPEGIKIMEELAFAHTAITSVVIPESIEHMYGGNQFAMCTSLKTVVWKPRYVSGVDYTDSEGNVFPIFSGATHVESFTFGENVQIIPASLCNSLGPIQSITIPNSVTTIEEKAFYQTGLRSVTIPENVEHVFGAAFQKCLLLQDVVWNARNVSGVDYYDSEKGGYMSIFTSANLRSITFGEHVETIPATLCTNSTNITSVVIPASVTKIEDKAFSKCTSLATVICNAVTPPVCGTTVFNDATYPGKLLLPSTSKYAYHDAAGWSNFFKDVLVDDKVANTFVLANYVDRYRDVTLSGRTLFHDGSFNTLCLPFDMSAADIAHSPLADYFKLKRFVSATVTNPGTADEELQITMENAHTIEAGVPYFISWESGADVVAPEFEAVKITAASGQTIGTSGDAVQCVGSFSPVSFTEGDYSKLFVGADNTLYWSSTNSSLKGFRAHFIINGASSAPARSGMRARIVEAPEVATGDPLTPCLEGKVVGTKAIVDGQLVITCGDRQYNAQGQLIK